MPLASLYPQLAGSRQMSRANSPVDSSRLPSESIIDPQELECEIRFRYRRRTGVEDYAESCQAEAEQEYEKLFEMGGRPTRPIRAHVDWGARIVDGMNHYRNEYERKNILATEDMVPEDANFVAHHWAEERITWFGEVRRWQEFKQTQQRYHQCDRSELELEPEDAEIFVADRWAKESNAWFRELHRWQEFKQTQQRYHQCDRSELDLELENTDVTLFEALSKLNDWQEFQLMHQTEVHEAEKMNELGQQGIVKSHGAMVVASSADAMPKFQEPQLSWMSDGEEAQEQLEASAWMSYVEDAQKQLETPTNVLSWVKSQWPDVIAEACSLVAGVPKNFEQQLEANFERQTKAIYRTLQEKGARPNHAVEAPDRNASLPRRIQHWIFQSSALYQELREWRTFMAWRQHIRNSGNMDQQRRRVLSEGDSRSEIFEDFVKYHQYGFDKGMSWLNSWRRQAREHREAGGSRLRCQRSGPLSKKLWCYHCAMDHDGYKDNEVPEAERAEKFAVQAEGYVSVAAGRLEESKQKLQDVLAESGPPSKSVTPPAYTRIQTPPTPPKSPSQEGLRKSRRSLEQQGSGANEYRQSKKERARKREANMANANREQYALPEGSSSSNKPDEDDEDTQMSNDAEDPSSIEIKANPKQIDSEDAVMSDAEDCADLHPSSPPGSYSWSIPQINHTTLPPPSPPSPMSRRTRSATKPDQVLFSKVLKKPTKNKPSKKAKVFTEQQQMALLNAAATEHPTAAPTPVGEIQPNPYPTPPTSIHSSQSSSSPSSRPPGSKKTRPAQEPNQVSSRKIQKPSKKDQLRKKAKTFTEEQTQILLHAATSSCHSTDPTSPESPVTATYPTTTTSANKDKIQSSGSPSLTSKDTLSTEQLDDTLSSEPHKDSNRNQSRKKVKKVTQQQTPALTNAASPNYPPTIPRRSERLKQKAATSKKMA